MTVNVNNLVVEASPHIRGPLSTTSIMRDVIIALVPAIIASGIIFGWRSLLLIASCIIFSVLFEYLYRKITKQDNTIGDLSAVVTGILLAFNLPVTLPIWMAAIGCFVAIVIVKQLFGGIGQNFANPAIVGRIVLLASFATPMTTWMLPTLENGSISLVAGATPLANGAAMPTNLDMFLGLRGGCLGETCILALLIGGIYLVVRRVITPTTPLAFFATVIVFCLFTKHPITQLMSGGIVLGAIFMATDYTTSPTTELGKVIFGVGCGIITMMIRGYGSYPEGVSFSILLMNILTPHIDNLTRTVPFGALKGGKRK